MPVPQTQNHRPKRRATVGRSSAPSSSEAEGIHRKGGEDSNEEASDAENRHRLI
jgi:hypothetical protein